MPIRTDFNGLDLLGHGAVCAAIGTGGSVRHTVDPAEKDRSFNPGPAPSVLWPELLTYFKGSTIAELFGARPQLAPACGCAAVPRPAAHPVPAPRAPGRGDRARRRGLVAAGRPVAVRARQSASGQSAGSSCAATRSSTIRSCWTGSSGSTG